MPTFPTLSRKPNYPLSPDGDTPEDELIESPMTAGYTITRPRFTRNKRTWGVSYKLLTLDDVATLRAWRQVELKKGSLAFDWVHPIENVTYNVRLSKGFIGYVATAPMRWDVRFTLIEV